MIVIDVETGGLDPHKNPLLSIGAVEFENQDNTFYVAIAPYGDLEITEQALAINGINVNEWRSKDPLEVAMKAFNDWVSPIPNKMIIGENPSFDRDFININLARCGIKSPFGYRTLDIHTAAFVKFKKAGIQFDKLGMDDTYRILFMEPEPKPHNALVGARMEAKAFSRLLMM